MSQIIKFSDEQHKRHPFREGLKNPPENRTKELKIIREWMESQPHLPYISDEYIYLFLHACYFNLDPTKHAIESYFTIRANAPAIFADKDSESEDILAAAEVVYAARLPQETPEGYIVLLHALRNSDTVDFNFDQAVKAFCMYNDCVLSEESLKDGYVVIFDAKYAKFKYLTRIIFSTLKAFMAYIQDAHPARLKGIHVLNTPSYVNQAMKIIAPLIRSELMGLVRFHKGSIPEGIPQEILPLEYGGNAPSIKDLHNEMLSLRSAYKQWLRESEYFIADETKRIKKNKWWSTFTSSNDNEMKNINVEKMENPTFGNLDID